MIQATLGEQGLAAKAVDHVHLLPWIDEWVNAATFNRYLPGTPIVYVDAVITVCDHQKTVTLREQIPQAFWPVLDMGAGARFDAGKPAARAGQYVRQPPGPAQTMGDRRQRS